MMNYQNENLVMNKPEIFLNIKFHLTWMSDAEARQELKQHFYLQECAYPSVGLMEKVLQDRADEVSDYLNRLYELKMKNLTYNPVENYDLYEDGTQHAHSNSSSTGSNLNNSFEFPMNQQSKKQVGQSDSSSSGTAQGNADSNHTLRRHGNIGITTGAQMLEGEIKIAQILYNLKHELCKQFDSFFMITI